MTICPRLARGYARQIDDRLAEVGPSHSRSVEDLYVRLIEKRLEDGKITPKAFAQLIDESAGWGDVPSVLQAHKSPMRWSGRDRQAGEVGVRWLQFAENAEIDPARSDVLDRRVYHVRCDYLTVAPRKTLGQQWPAPLAASAHLVERMILRGGVHSDGADIPQELDEALAFAGLWFRAWQGGFIGECADIVVPAHAGVICGGWGEVTDPLGLQGLDIRHGRRSAGSQRIPGGSDTIVLYTYLADEMLTPARGDVAQKLRAWAATRRDELLWEPLAWFVWPGHALASRQIELVRSFADLVEKLGVRDLFVHQRRRADAQAA